MDSGVSLTGNDWSLHRKGPIDQARHKEKIKEAIRENLPNIVSEEAIITSDGKTIVKVPIRSLDLPRFRFDYRKKQYGGQGDGDSKAGDVIGKEKADGPSAGKQAGDQPGIDYYEAEITVDELAAMIFEDLCLPYLEPKSSEFEVIEEKCEDVRKKGLMSNLDRRRTILENIRRNARQGQPGFRDITQDDLRFRTWRETIRRDSNAVVIAMRDVSGSMGEFEKYISRSFYFWMVRFLRQKYSNVKIVFITHHTEAKIVDEETFFKLGESGGTRVSSAYRLALDTIEREYNPEHWNIYPFHFSDGDNWGEDNETTVSLAKKLLDVSNAFGYGEIREGGSRNFSTLMNAFTSGINDDRLIIVEITRKEDVLPALKEFFRVREEV